MTARVRLHLRQNVVGYVAIFLFGIGGTALAVDGPLPGTNQVGSSDIINDDVRSGDIRNETLTDGDIGAGAVRGSEIRDSSVGSIDLADGGVKALDIQNSQSPGDPILGEAAVFENLAVQEAEYAQFLKGPADEAGLSLLVDPEDVYLTEDRANLFVDWATLSPESPVQDISLVEGGVTSSSPFQLQLDCTETDVAERIRYRDLPGINSPVLVWQDNGAADTDFFGLAEGTAMPGFNSSSTAVEDGPGGNPDKGDHVQYTILGSGSNPRLTTVDVTAVKQAGPLGHCIWAITATNAVVN